MSFPVKENVCAILTSFNPDEGFLSRVKVISNQFGHTVIIDNNSYSESKVWLEKISLLDRVGIIYNSVNAGVAAALNQGIGIAKSKSFEWVMLFDQDTLVSGHFFETISLQCRQIGDECKVGIIGAGYSENKNSIVLEDSGQTLKETDFVITSGSLLRLSVYDQAGPFPDDFFIDYVDIEYCLRLRSKGFKVFLVDTPLMFHPIGSLTIHNFLWKKVGTSNHSSLRRYYMMRNHMIVIGKYFRIFPGWSVRSLIERFNTVLKIILYEKNKNKKLKYSFLGLIDGLSGKRDRIFNHSL